MGAFCFRKSGTADPPESKYNFSDMTVYNELIQTTAAHLYLRKGEIIMAFTKLIVKLPDLIPRALAGDPTAIAMLALAGIAAGSEYLKHKN